jgi:5-methylcytosine-specific restriction endonuclease McrA
MPTRKRLSQASLEKRMIQISKQPRQSLTRERYRELHRQVLERDGWRCQACGSMCQLEVHHQQFRSRSGDDIEQNLITLCVECHAGVHR